MEISSRVTQTRDYSSNVLRQSFNSSNMQKMTSSSQIIDELRRKYDTPTRRELKELHTKQAAIQKPQQHFHQDLDMKKSINMPVFGESSVRQTWGNRNTLNSKVEISPSPIHKKQNINVGEQETIFRKIKQMKDSILNKNQKIKTTKSIYEPRFQEKVDTKTLISENRVENIDKINNKIQQILNCLKESENRVVRQSDFRAPLMKQTQSKVEQRLQQKYNPKTYESSSRNYAYSRPSLVTEKASMIGYESNKSNYPLQKVEAKSTSSIYQQDKKYKAVSPVPKNVQSFEGLGRGGEPRVRSFISSVQKDKQASGVVGKYEMKSGKKLDDEISKIESKIHQFEEQKRKLNIDFKPYSYSNSKSSTNLVKRSYTITKGGQKNQFHNVRNFEDIAGNGKKTGAGERGLEKNYDSKSQTRFSFQPRFQSKKEKSFQSITVNSNIQKKNEYLEPSEKVEKYERKDFSSGADGSSIFKLKLVPVDGQHSGTSSKIQNKFISEDLSKNDTDGDLKNNDNSRVQNKMLSEDIRRRADEGILDRKKKLSSESSTRSKHNIKKLVEKLSEQTRLDQQFRNRKLYFQSNLNKSKWDDLQSELKKKGVRLDKEKMKKIFNITDEQNNPFFSIRESQGSIETLVNSYVESEKHWDNELKRKIGKQQLLRQDLSSNSFDLQKKGYIVLEDIVRFLNMETGTFYRNRDLFLIFKRISEQEKISFEELIGTFCK